VFKFLVGISYKKNLSLR